QQFRRRLARSLTLRIFAATQEKATAARAQLHRCTALRTRLGDLHGRRGFLHRGWQECLELILEFLRHLLSTPTLRKGATTQKRSPLAHALQHRFPASRTGVFRLHRRFARRFALARLDVLALRIAGTAEELAPGFLTEADDQGLLAEGALLAGLDALETLHLG